MLKSFEKFIENLMFASRWLLLAPFYFGLIISLFFLLIVFIKEIIHFVTHFSTDETELILFILTLIRSFICREFINYCHFFLDMKTLFLK